MKNTIHPYYDVEYLFNLLRRHNLLTQEQILQLTPRTVVAKRRGQDLVQWLSGLHLNKADGKGILEEADILTLIAQDQNWTFMRLDPLKLEMDTVTRLLPASFARKRLVLPINVQDDLLTAACYNPLDKELKGDIERVFQGEIRLIVAPKADIEYIIRDFFEFKRSILAAETALYDSNTVDISNLEQYISLASPETAASDKHIQKAVDHLLQYAMEQRASDIHIEPKRNETWIRLRIDGMLHTVYRLPRTVHEAISTRIKAMSRLDIAEKRRPQDGRLKIAWKSQEAEVRVSTVPVAFGEKVVLRLQSADILFKDLTELGFSDHDLRSYQKILQHTHGIVLMTGPTGSGKSTTLYSTLRHLSTPAVNIVSIEDPVEMIHEEFNQIAVQPHIDVTFSSILRNILRQDPDIIMVGEIRDLETARYAIQAALTGHLVFSTLHTNDAAGAITRLKDLGLESYLISSTLLGVVGQRLVRMICPACKTELTVTPQDLAPLGYLRAYPSHEAQPITIAYGKGCTKCRNTGFWGRIGIYEILTVSDAVKELIHDQASEQAIYAQAIKDGMTSMQHDGLRKVLNHITTPEEVLRVIST
ncbi:MAG: ATPase, T2SS/T4P/T4SS family [Dissulfuribacterales bacterium]